MNELALFAGAGGGLLASHLLGWNTTCAVEKEGYPREVLLQRQRDGIFPKFPIWDDVCTFDGHPWCGTIDIVTGGFPCQDISPARTNNGGRANGLDGEKSGLWREYKRIIEEVQPAFVFAENSSHLRTKGLVRILKDLDSLGYNARWCVLGSGDIGANHERDRMWIFAYSHNYGQSTSTKHVETQGVQGIASLPTKASDPNSTQCERGWLPSGRNEKFSHVRVDSWWKNISHLDRMDDGVAHRRVRRKAIGNGQVPAVAVTAFLLLSKGIIN